jgi:hypothetical protein
MLYHQSNSSKSQIKVQAFTHTNFYIGIHRINKLELYEVLVHSLVAKFSTFDEGAETTL